MDENRIDDIIQKIGISKSETEKEYIIREKIKNFLKNIINIAKFDLLCYNLRERNLCMDKINIAYDHYKDTFTLQRENEQTRNILFLLLCLSLLVLMLMSIFPNNIYQNIKELALNNWGMSIEIELSIIEIFNWFIVVYLTIRYYQLNANIEKNYIYIHKIEKDLEKKHKLSIYREGRNYLKHYPLFLNFSYFFYKYFFPIVFTVCITIKFVLNIFSKENCIIFSLTIVMYIILVILNLSYISFNYKLRNGDKE